MNSNVKPDKGAILAYAAALWFACGLAASNALADDARSEVIKFNDLNLGSQAGVEALYGRIHAAAWRVCQQPGGELAAVGGCMRKAESAAVGKVNNSLLTAFYQKKTGSEPQTITASR